MPGVGHHAACPEAPQQLGRCARRPLSAAPQAMPRRSSPALISSEMWSGGCASGHASERQRWRMHQDTQACATGCSNQRSLATYWQARIASGCTGLLPQDLPRSSSLTWTRFERRQQHRQHLATAASRPSTRLVPSRQQAMPILRHDRLRPGRSQARPGSPLLPLRTGSCPWGTPSMRISPEHVRLSCRRACRCCLCCLLPVSGCMTDPSRLRHHTRGPSSSAHPRLRMLTTAEGAARMMPMEALCF